MPYLNPNGIEFCSGKAGAGVFKGNIHSDDIIEIVKIFDQGGEAHWLNSDEIICQEFSQGARIASFNVRTGQTRTLLTVGVTNLTTDKNGNWASYFDGVIDSSSRIFPISFISDNCMGAYGFYAMKNLYNSYGPWHFIPSGMLMTNGDASSVYCYNDELATWIENGTVHSIGLPTPNILTKEFWWPRAIFVNNQWWITYQTPFGFYLHPIGSSYGYKIPGSLFYNPDVLQIDTNHVRVVWSIDAGGTQVMVKTIDLTSIRVILEEPAVPPAPPVVKPPIVIPPVKPPVKPPKEKVMVGLVIPQYVCEEVSNGDNTYSLKKDGYWMTIEIDGSITFRQPADEGHRGPWETFTKDGNMYVELPKDGITRPTVKVAG